MKRNCMKMSIILSCMILVITLTACVDKSKKKETLIKPPKIVVKEYTQQEQDSLKKALTPVEYGNIMQELYLGNGDLPRSIDPHIATGEADSKIIYALLEGLVSVHPKTLALQPGIAESWTVSDDHRVFTFTIGKNRKWSTGTPITAEDIRWSWERLLSKELKSEKCYVLFHIKNAEKFNKGIVSFDDVGIKVIDNKTIEVTTASPCPFFPKVLLDYSTFPIEKESFFQYESTMYSRGENWTTPQRYSCSGPFTFNTFGLNKIFTVEKNHHYWDKEMVTLRKINFFPGHRVGEERLFRNLKLHITNTIPTRYIWSYKEKNRSELLMSPYLGTYYYRLNVRNDVLKNKLVRKALSLAIDRKALVEKVLEGSAFPAFSFTPPDCAGYTPIAQNQYNPKDAQELLRKAGFPNGKGIPPLPIQFNESKEHKKLAMAIAVMWKKTLGVEVKFESKYWKDYLTDQHQGRYIISRAGWVGDYLDPDTFLGMFTTKSVNNQTGWSHEKYDGLMEKGALAKGEKRYQLFQEAEAILLEEQPIIPIYYYTKKYLKSTAVKGWYPNVMDRHPYKYIYLMNAEKSN